MSHLSFVDLGRMAVIIASLHKWCGGLSGQLSVKFFFVSTLLAKYMASLRLFTLIKVKYSLYGRVFLKFLKSAFLHSSALLRPDSFSEHKSQWSLYFHQI